MLQDNHSKFIIIIIGAEIPVLRCYQTRVFDSIKITGLPGYRKPGSVCLNFRQKNSKKKFSNKFLFI